MCTLETTLYLNHFCGKTLYVKLEDCKDQASHTIGCFGDVQMDYEMHFTTRPEFSVFVDVSQAYWLSRLLGQFNCFPFSPSYSV